MDRQPDHVIIDEHGMVRTTRRLPTLHNPTPTEQYIQDTIVAGVGKVLQSLQTKNTEKPVSSI